MATHAPTAEQRAALEQMVANATSDTNVHGERRADYAGASDCRCERAAPSTFEYEGETLAICGGCSKALNLDTLGIPYRRWPGDLQTPHETMKHVVASAHEEMLALVRQLPEREQKRLANVARIDPAKFNQEARRTIDRHQAITAHDAAPPTSPKQRRLARTGEQP